jgi:hypothetical protein
MLPPAHELSGARVKRISFSILSGVTTVELLEDRGRWKAGQWVSLAPGQFKAGDKK